MVVNLGILFSLCIAIHDRAFYLLDQIGYGQFPGGLDPKLPFICIVWWTNRELIHHLGEVGLLRDLWSAKQGTRG